ncbi:MAG: enoyl-CoA hydratase/isomerase family protein [Ktedonobacteraceae bacterium]
MKIPSPTAITLDITQDVAWITLNRPPLNILTLDIIRELDSVLSVVAEQTNLKAVVLAANGKAFCAGVDVADHTPDRVEPMIREFGQLFTRLRTLPMPTIALVQGAALGGGCELAIACDLMIAAESAKFGQPEIKLGVFPPIAAALFPQLIGHQQTARLLFSGETINAAEAVRLGLATYVAANDDLQPTLDRLLTQYRNMSAAALRITKRAILYGNDLGVNALLEIEDLYLRDLMDTADAHEGIQAFMEKRQPIWSDK